MFHYFLSLKTNQSQKIRCYQDVGTICLSAFVTGAAAADVSFAGVELNNVRIWFIELISS
jgi:hypothetical protein